MGIDQLSLFPDPRKPQLSNEEAAEHIARVALKPENIKAVERAYDPEAARLGLLDDKEPVTKPEEFIPDERRPWRENVSTASEKRAGKVGIASARLALQYAQKGQHGPS